MVVGKASPVIWSDGLRLGTTCRDRPYPASCIYPWFFSEHWEASEGLHCGSGSGSGGG